MAATRITHRSDLGPKFSEGARLAWLAMQAANEGFVDVERRVGARPRSGMTSRWLYGDVKPVYRYRKAFHEQYGVHPALWDDPPDPTQPKFEPPAAVRRTGTEG